MFFIKNQNSGIKRWHLAVFGIIIAGFIFLKLSDWLYFPRGEVTFGNETIKVLIANTPHRAYKGLGGRNDLNDYGGMWFDFLSRDLHAIVMRDMRFSIDVVRLDNDVIVDIARNLPLESEKTENELVPYYPGRPATNILEMPAGSADLYGLKIGGRVEFYR